MIRRIHMTVNQGRKLARELGVRLLGGAALGVRAVGAPARGRGRATAAAAATAATDQPP